MRKDVIHCYIQKKNHKTFSYFSRFSFNRNPEQNGNFVIKSLHIPRNLPVSLCVYRRKPTWGNHKQKKKIKILGFEFTKNSNFLISEHAIKSEWSETEDRGVWFSVRTRILKRRANDGELQRRRERGGRGSGFYGRQRWVWWLSIEPLLPSSRSLFCWTNPVTIFFVEN